MELHGADVVQVPQQREQAPPQLVVPHLGVCQVPGYVLLGSAEASSCLIL